MTWFRIGLASLVTAVWLLDFVNATYIATDAGLHDGLTGLMVIVLGWALGGEARDSLKRRLQRALEDDDAEKD